MISAKDISLLLTLLEDGTEKPLEDIIGAVNKSFGKGESWRVGLAVHTLLSSPSILPLPHRLLGLYLLVDLYRGIGSVSLTTSTSGTSNPASSSSNAPLASVANNPFLPTLLSSLERDFSAIEHHYVATIISQTPKDVRQFSIINPLMSALTNNHPVLPSKNLFSLTLIFLSF